MQRGTDWRMEPRHAQAWSLQVAGASPGGSLSWAGIESGAPGSQGRSQVTGLVMSHIEDRLSSERCPSLQVEGGTPPTARDPQSGGVAALTPRLTLEPSQDGLVQSPGLGRLSCHSSQVTRALSCFCRGCPPSGQGQDL